MSGRPDPIRVLQGAAALLVLAGVAALAWPVPLPRGTTARLAAAVPVVQAGSAASDSDEVATIIEKNLFAATRHPPAIRYRPPGVTATGPEPVTEAAKTPGADVPGADRERNPSRARLYGIISDGDVPVALLDLDPSRRGARGYRVGEGAGGWKIVRIEATAVTLDGPGGTLVLRLPNSRTSSP